ncbi:hypothetical protein EV184_10860 [Sinorhizobium americanum]|uniref:Uncharacterized protein n=1 Tax=Sinorhizobium americanum TaxID=194963 RepID=A0A4R2BVL6_9HYPH|nr:hypothetical protein EV184_10860 [Sinorhizobium americanum]
MPYADRTQAKQVDSSLRHRNFRNYVTNATSRRQGVVVEQEFWVRAYSRERTEKFTN